MNQSREVPDFTNFQLTLSEAKKNYPLREPRSQGGDLSDPWLEERFERGAFGHPRNLLNKEFMLRHPLMNDSTEEDKEWGPVRMLGKGGFGMVGLWEKRDKDNKTVDRVAIKQAKAGGRSGYLELRDPENLLREAVIQHDLNTKSEDSFPWLRRYKWMPQQSATKKRFALKSSHRLYLEFCEHGDLETLRGKYRLWDQYLPELFLWHLFYRLAIAGDALREPPPEDSLIVANMRKRRAEANDKFDEFREARNKRPKRRRGRRDSLAQREKKFDNDLDEVRTRGEWDGIIKDPAKRPPNGPQWHKTYDFQNWFTVHFDIKPVNVLLANNDWEATPQTLPSTVPNDSDPDAQQETTANPADTSNPVDNTDVTDNTQPTHPDTTPAKASPSVRERGDIDDPDYPLPKMSDFGLSQYTTWGQKTNPRDFFRYGTRCFRGPEQHGYGAHWAIPPTGSKIRNTMYSNGVPRVATNQWALGEQREAEDEITFDHSLNIYGIGRIMFSMSTLTDEYALHGKYSAGIAKLRAPTLTGYRANYNHQIRSVRTTLPHIYTPRLRHLIWRCLDPNPANRPSQIELRDKTRRGLDLFVAKCRARDESGQPRLDQKLFYRGSEINDMPRGEAGFQPRWDEVREVLQAEFLDPDRPRLRLPREKFEALVERPDEVVVSGVAGGAGAGRTRMQCFQDEMDGAVQLWRKRYTEQPGLESWFTDVP